MASDRKRWFKMHDSILHETWPIEIKGVAACLLAHLNTRWQREGLTSEEACFARLSPAAAMLVTGSQRLTKARSMLSRLSVYTSLTVGIDGVDTLVLWPKFAEKQGFATRQTPPPNPIRSDPNNTEGKGESEGERDPEPAASIAGEASVPADAGPTPPQRCEPEPPEPPPRPLAVVATSGAAPARPPRAKPQPRDGGSDLLADAAFLASLAANNPLGVPVTPEEARAWLAQKLPIMRERRVSKYRLAAVNWWSRLRRDELDAARRYARNAALAPLAEAMRDAPPQAVSSVESIDWMRERTVG